MLDSTGDPVKGSPGLLVFACRLWWLVGARALYRTYLEVSPLGSLGLHGGWICMPCLAFLGTCLEARAYYYPTGLDQLL